MLKSRQYLKINLLIVLSLLLCAGSGIALANMDCDGGYSSSDPTATGEFNELPDPGGQLEITSLPFLMNNSLHYVDLTIRNITPSQVSLTNGVFSVEFKYTPAGGNPDGSDDIVVTSYANVNCTELLYDNSMNAAFYPSAAIPVDRWSSIECILTFSGDLGARSNSWIGKTFSPGDLLFNEEWDNGLTGNHAWNRTSTNMNTDPTNGFSSVSVIGDKLDMRNRRYAGNTTPRVNRLEVDLTDGSTPNGILITSNTHLQFFIDELTTNSNDNQAAEHYLFFELNNGAYSISYSTDQNLIGGPSQGVVSFKGTFNPGELRHKNIYQGFIENGYTPPINTYLTKIGFVQYAYLDPNHNPNVAEINFNLLVDAVHIVEKKVQ